MPIPSRPQTGPSGMRYMPVAMNSDGTMAIPAAGFSESLTNSPMSPFMPHDVRRVTPAELGEVVKQSKFRKTKNKECKKRESVSEEHAAPGSEDGDQNGRTKPAKRGLSGGDKKPSSGHTPRRGPSQIPEQIPGGRVPAVSFGPVTTVDEILAQYPEDLPSYRPRPAGSEGPPPNLSPQSYLFNASPEDIWEHCNGMLKKNKTKNGKDTKIVFGPERPPGMKEEVKDDK